MSDDAGERRVEPRSRQEWRAWLAEHGDDGVGTWLVIHKGHSGPLTYEEAVEEAVAAGWIDSKAYKVDGLRYQLWMAPRKKRSVWAPSNKRRVARLTELGLMTERGKAVVEAAKANGSWESLDAVMALDVPTDLAEALAASPAAAQNFARFSPSVKRMILQWLQQARKPETRERRIADIAASAAQNAKPGPWSGNEAEG